MKWRLYYDDGTTFCDADGDWSDAPPYGVQALVTEDPDVGWECNEGSDGWLHNYVWWPGHDRPYGVDQYGTLDYLVAVGALDVGQPLSSLPLDQLAEAGVKVGRTIDTPAFRRIIAAARADDYFPAKSAKSRAERG